MTKFVPINKGNYSLDTQEREESFSKKIAFGVEAEYYNNRKQWNEYPQRFLISEYPLLVDLELSTVCNLKCPFCYTITDEFKKQVKPSFMDYELYKKVIDEISGKVFGIRLSLRGEPTLHPNFIEAIEYAKQKGIKEVSTLTNGSKLSSEYFEKIMLAGIDWVTISFDGLYEEYNKNRYPLKYNEMHNKLKNIKKIKEKHNMIKPVIKLQSVWPAIEKNPSEYYNTLSLVSDLLAFNPLIDFTSNTEAKEKCYEEDFSCPQLYQRLVIGANGEVMICSNDEESELIIGNAQNKSVYDLWHSEELNRIRDIHKKKDGFKEIGICRKCYLPRKTYESYSMVNDRQIIINNYL